MIRFVFAFTILVFAGCLDTGRPQEPSPEVSEPPATASPPASQPPDNPQVSSYAQDAVWTNCQGVVAQLRYVPGTLFEAEQNPHWEEYGEQYGNHDLSMLECERISWGSFERPVRFILESHSEVKEPETCLRPQTGQLYRVGMVASIWVDDPELAAYLQAEYGLPVHAADIVVEVDGSGPLPVQVWRWGPPGQPASELQTPMDPLPRDVRLPFDWRFFWFNETAVSVMDLHQEFESPFWPDDVAVDLHEVGTRASHGKLEAPMLASTLPVYVAQGEYRTNVQWSGYITKYTDHQCSEEVP